ncbi:type II secretion system protein [Oceanisphaera sp.]|uniref:type II secretion system protein n=1 Tax=Oceanisphaera sp. TaxID=1929979 RepID=UPI003A92E130
MERIKRELNLAYSPSVYISPNEVGIANRCVSFVPVLTSGHYVGDVIHKNANFIIPLTQQENTITDVNLAVQADSGQTVWQDYPDTLPTNVATFKSQTPKAPLSVSFADAFDPPAPIFSKEGRGNRYTLLHQRQVRFCLQGDKLLRAEKTGSDWLPAPGILMLSNLTSNSEFSSYDDPLQLLVMSLSLQTQDGELVLPSQIQVAYEP